MNNIELQFFATGPVIMTASYTPTLPAEMTPRERHEDERNKRSIRRELNRIRHKRPNVISLVK